MPRPRLRAALTATALVTAVVLGGCSSSEPPPPPQPGPGAAHAPPDPRPSAAGMLGDVLGTMTARGSVHTDVRGQLGVVGQVHGSGALHYQDDPDTAAPDTAAPDTAAPDPDPNAAGADAAANSDVTLHGQTRSGRAPEPVALSIVDQVGYLRTPLLPTDNGAPWLRVPAQGTDATAALLGPPLRQLHDALDPRAALGDVRGAVRIQDTSTEALADRPVTRYDLRLDTRQAANETDDPQRQRKFRSAAESGRAEQRFQLWVDEQNLPVRFSSAPRVDAPGASGPAALTTTYSDWAEPAAIAPPAPSEVGELGRAPKGHIGHG
ncbi:hypothetical protein [Bounagaea algeriensis]